MDFFRQAQKIVHTGLVYFRQFNQYFGGHCVDSILIGGISPPIDKQQIGNMLLCPVPVFSQLSNFIINQYSHPNLIINARISAIDFWQKFWHNKIEVIKVEPYREMYYLLFNRVTDVIRDLQDAQKETESLFLEKGPEHPISALRIYPKHKD